VARKPAGAPLRTAAIDPIVNHMVQYAPRLDASFAALSDRTRRGVLERLGRGDASISDLAAKFAMTLTGMKKHVQVLEAAGLVTTEKTGRVRTCRLGPRRLEDETTWIVKYQQMLEARLDRLGAFLERTKGSPS
jgi:DNA-binding transcriptional ArsR family regulator